MSFYAPRLKWLKVATTLCVLGVTAWGVVCWLRPMDSANQPRAGERWTNSLGMAFVPVPGTEVLFCIWETRVQDFRAFAADSVGNGGWNYRIGGEPYVFRNDGLKQRGWDYDWSNPGFSQTDEHPVTCVSWKDAQAFCQWLTKKERAGGRLSVRQSYRLPQDWEWSVAVGLGEPSGGTPAENHSKTNMHPWGTQWPPPVGAGNFAGREVLGIGWATNGLVISNYQDGFARTSPVGSFSATGCGIHDLAGNVWEWCEDWLDVEQKLRVLRGGNWAMSDPNISWSSNRLPLSPLVRYDGTGFRCVLVVSGP